MNSFQLWGFETFIEYLAPALKLAHGYIDKVEVKAMCCRSKGKVIITYSNGLEQVYEIEERDSYKTLALKIFMNLPSYRDF